jgi:hypothetical protein
LAKYPVHLFPSLFINDLIHLVHQGYRTKDAQTRDA